MLVGLFHLHIAVLPHHKVGVNICKPTIDALYGLVCRPYYLLRTTVVLRMQRGRNTDYGVPPESVHCSVPYLPQVRSTHTYALKLHTSIVPDPARARTDQ